MTLGDGPKMLPIGVNEATKESGYIDVDDIMMLTILRCWGQSHIGDFFLCWGLFRKCLQYLKVVTDNSNRL